LDPKKIFIKLWHKSFKIDHTGSPDDPGLPDIPRSPFSPGAPGIDDTAEGAGRPE
jgi:hypothetical protein